MYAVFTTISDLGSKAWNSLSDNSNGVISCYDTWPLVLSFCSLFRALKVKRGSYSLPVLSVTSLYVIEVTFGNPQ